MTTTIQVPSMQSDRPARPVASTILELRDLRKYFGGVKAVDGVSFSISAGEVHAIVGENGAGKSTLMNILAGVLSPDSGDMALVGAPYRPQSPSEARAAGVSIVFQELALFPSLPVEANIFIDRELTHGPGLDHPAMRRRTEGVLRQMDVNLAAGEDVGDLTIGEQQWVEIARALNDEASVLILDEPNSALNQHETEALFALLERLRNQGITLIYISHRLEEVFRIADRISVMRDGHYVGTWRTEETTISQIVSEMIGREVDEVSRRDSRAQEEVVLQVDDLTVEYALQPTHFSVRKGEVLGFAGLAGAGITPLFEALFGIRPIAAGRVLLRGEPAALTSAHTAMEHEIAMVPADRRTLGLMLNWSVLSNVRLGILERLSRFGIIDHAQARAVVEDYVERLDIVTDSLDKQVLYLSGGNQQKVLLARWLATDPRVLILDDPTRGIDVGAKREIYALIDDVARQGLAVLLTSSEIEETLALSDRILVLRNGQQVAELPQAVATKGLVMEFAAGDLDVADRELASRMAAEPVPSPATALVAGEETEAPASVGFDSDPAFAPSTGASRSVFGRLGGILQVREIGVLLALFAVVGFFALLTPHFLTLSNLLLISRQMAILAVIAFGMTFVLASGEVDLSVGWIFNLAMTVMALMMVRFGLDPWLAVAIGLAAGMALGAVNGLLAVTLNLPTIIITLGTLTVFRGFSLALNQGRTISGLPESGLLAIGAESLGPVSYMTLLMFATGAIMAWVLANTRFARHVLAMGSNPPAADKVGLPTKRLRIQVMMLSGLMCGIAGYIGLAYLGAADPQSGAGYELIAIAAAIIGGAQLGGGSGTIWGTLIGIALIMTIQNGLVLLGLRPAWQIAATGLIIIAAVTIDYAIRARRAKTRAAIRFEA